MLVIGDPLNATICPDFDANHSCDLPCALAEMQENDRGLTIDVAERQPPRHGHA